MFFFKRRYDYDYDKDIYVIIQLPKRFTVTSKKDFDTMPMLHTCKIVIVKLA